MIELTIDQFITMYKALLKINNKDKDDNLESFLSDLRYEYDFLKQIK